MAGTTEEENSDERKMRNLIDFQKRLDVYSCELESKYKKLLSFDELRSEVIAQVDKSVQQP